MNPPLIITRAFDIDMGHRLLRHESKCAHLHGHRYTVQLSVSAPTLDDVGRIIDFSVIKDVFGAWLDGVYDHGFTVQQGDPLLGWLVAHNQKHHVMAAPPTIENLVVEWFKGAETCLNGYGLEVVHVRGYETAKCWADFNAPGRAT